MLVLCRLCAPRRLAVPGRAKGKEAAVRLVNISILVAVRDGIENDQVLAQLDAALNGGQPGWGGAEISLDSKVYQRRLGSSAICQNCGITFIARRSDAMYCSAACRMVVHAAKAAAKARAGHA
jgi:hypothetical protein